MKFKITITKEVIDKSLMCGTENRNRSLYIGQSCGFAVAYAELIPGIYVNGYDIRFHKKIDYKLKDTPIATVKPTNDQFRFINTFDSMDETPEKRYTLVGQTFDVEIPDEVIEYWHGDAVTAAQKLIDNPIMQTV